MSDEADTGDAPPKKKSKALLFGLVGAVVLGGGAFFAVYSGLVPLGGAPEEMAEGGGEAGYEMAPGYAAMEMPVYVPLDPLIIPLSPEARSRHLRVSLHLEVRAEAEDAVMGVTPRVVDVLNTFLRAVDEREFENPRAMSRLRAQMLRRVQLVAPEGAVRDVLIQEFLLN